MPSLSHRVTLAGFLRTLSAIPVAAALSAIPATTITIPDSTPVKLFLIDRISSATSQVDDPVRFGVAEDVRIGRVVVIPQGSVASGHLVEAQHRKKLGQAGKLELALDYVKAPDGTYIRLRTSAGRQVKGQKSKRMSPLLLLSRGKEAGMAQGTHVVAFVDGPIEIEAGNLPAASAGPIASQPAAQVNVPASNSDISSIVVSSTPDRADITVDSKFLGTTPSTIRLAPGEHSVTIERSGFKAWRRTMTVTAGGSITLDVTLEKIP
jgi:hypothetical protein